MASSPPTGPGAPSGSSVRRRVLGQQLRSLRKQARLTIQTAATAMEWSEPKLWRLETGQTAIRALDVENMCTAYGAPADLTQALAALARQTKTSDSWHTYDEAIPDDFSMYTMLEDAACELAGYAAFQVPRLLRTEPYARALVNNHDHSSDEVDRLVGECLARRVLITRASAAVAVTLVLDEMLIRRPVGGPEVMAGQLRHLADLAALPNVCLRALPIGVGIHPGLRTGPFTLLHFRPSNHNDDTDTAIVHTSGLTGELFLDQPHEVGSYRDAFVAILDNCPDQTATQDLLLTVAKELEQ